MQRIDNSGAVASLPTPLAAGTPGYFSRGNAGSGVKATPLSADWANMVQEELIAIVLAAGLTPGKTVFTQVRDAIAALYLGKAGGLMTGALGVVAGSAAAPGMYFSGDTNTGIYSPGADQVGFVTGGVDRYRIASDGSRSAVIPGGSTLYPDYGTRGWVNFNGTNGTLRGGGNMAVTRTAVGKYDITITSMPDGNYGVSSCVGVNDAPGASNLAAANWYLPTSTSFKVAVGDTSANTFDDVTYVGLSLHR